MFSADPAERLNNHHYLKGSVMSLSISRRVALLIVGALASLSLALALSSSASAVGVAFCDNQTVGPNQPCFADAPRTTQSAEAKGSTHSVCVGVNLTAGPCSSGPNVYAVMVLPAPANGATPWVAFNGSTGTPTVVFGDTI
jgi:hypothetical protein